MFNNTDLKFRNRPLYIKRWILSGIKHVNDIFNGENFKSLSDLKDYIPNYGGLVLDFNAVKTSIINYNKKSISYW